MTTPEKSGYEKKLEMMSRWQRAENMLMDSGFPVGVDFETMRPVYLVVSRYNPDTGIHDTDSEECVMTTRIYMRGF